MSTLYNFSHNCGRSLRIDRRTSRKSNCVESGGDVEWVEHSSARTNIRIFHYFQIFRPISLCFAVFRPIRNVFISRPLDRTECVPGVISLCAYHFIELYSLNCIQRVSQDAAHKPSTCTLSQNSCCFVF